MLSKDLIKFVNDPHLLTEQSVKDLQALVTDFPYFQSANLLLSLASKKWDTSVYQQSLKKTAIVATNRAHLFSLIHSFENVDKKPVEKSVASDQVEEITQKESASHELNILKAAEISVEPETTTVKKPEVVSDKKEDVVAPEPKVRAEEVLEKEIGKEVVNAFVEKEILKTNEFHIKSVIKEEPASFGDWLVYMKKNNGQSYGQIEAKVNEQKQLQLDKETKVSADPNDPVEETQVNSRKQKNKSIIDKIIEKNPGLIRTREEQKFFTPEIKAKESLLENEHLVTETLARIYALQGSVNKAVRAYEILSLKFPQKSAYFATLIKNLKENQ